MALSGWCWRPPTRPPPTTSLPCSLPFLSRWPTAFKEPGIRLRSAALGLVVALAATGLAAVAGFLQEPSLLPADGPVAESVVSALLGGGLGAAVVLWPERTR